MQPSLIGGLFSIAISSFNRNTSMSFDQIHFEHTFANQFFFFFWSQRYSSSEIVSGYTVPILCSKAERKLNNISQHFGLVQSLTMLKATERRDKSHIQRSTRVGVI